MPAEIPHKSLLENPDTGLVGTPATYSAALSVASVDNDGYTQLYITVDGQEFGYLDTAAKAATNFQENFRNKELEYVMVPGYGADSDYEGIDVTGKVAVISRGTSSFPEKQSIAQAHGAIAAIIYNNELGVIRMQINDGEGNIPAISVTLACGEALKNGSGKLTVCNGDTKLFRLDRTVSSFSSWGVTPDLKLKPEISGVGGSIYSATDPAISGGYYNYMSGTSMATPQITGAMAVLIEYLDKHYPDLTGAEQRRVAADLLMSTADPLMATSTLEYSPRAQGAGLANLVSATTTPAYLSNKDASEGRPKIEFGDDDNKTGVYTFTFEINNLKDKAPDLHPVLQPHHRGHLSGQVHQRFPLCSGSQGQLCWRRYRHRACLRQRHRHRHHHSDRCRQGLPEQVPQRYVRGRLPLCHPHRRQRGQQPRDPEPASGRLLR